MNAEPEIPGWLASLGHVNSRPGYRKRSGDRTHIHGRIAVPLRMLYDFVCRELQVSSFSGIGVVSLSNRAPAQFAELTTRSLSLLEEVDPRRLERVRRHIKWIVNAPTTLGEGSANYSLYFKRCCIDLAESTSYDVTDMFAAYYASVIVHEATHGMLATRGFRYKGRKRLQHERICCAEQNRVLSRLDAVVPGVWARFSSEFNPSRWSRFLETE